MLVARWRHLQRGQMIPLLAVSIFALIGMVALAVDVGYWRYEQRLQQSAADSAAIAAGVETDYSSLSSDMVAFGRKDAAANGFTDGQNNVTVTINQPPTLGPYAGNANAVEAIVSKVQATFFSGIFGNAAPTVTTRAVAIKSTSGTDCVYALNKTGSKKAGITIDGGSSGFDAHTCGIITDSILTVNGAPTIQGQSIGVANYGSSTIGQANYSIATPAPAVAVNDPCSSLPSCAAFAAAAPYSSPVPQTAAPPYTTANGVTTFYPGTYTNTLTVPNGTVVFAPGVYVLNVPGGTSFDASGSITMSGTGVTFYNEAGTFNIKGTGSSSISFTAPDSGSLSGLVYYQPPSNTQTVTWDGNDHLINFAGIVYLPSASLYLNGTAPKVSTLIADTIEVNGQGLTVTGPQAGQTRGHFVLAE